MRKLRHLLFVIGLIAACWAIPAAAQDAVPEETPQDTPEAVEEGAEGEAAEAETDAPPEPPPPVYDDQLLRLAEILGALAFLRDLCGHSDGELWRGEMLALINAENPPPLRRGRLIGRFNHGFETFNAVYRACTPSAERAIGRYLVEGEALAADVRSRYGQ
ncbi:MAG TPA: TIGR02301 family protein [Dongiaceae bacterium]|jgi:uncharacterized protein (TIGR02301 family)